MQRWVNAALRLLAVDEEACYLYVPLLQWLHGIRASTAPKVTTGRCQYQMKERRGGHIAAHKRPLYARAASYAHHAGPLTYSLKTPAIE